jgi:hypothetical protein
MSAPLVNSVTFDKTAYNPGDTIHATVTFTPGSSGQSFSLTGTATDSATGQAGSLTVNFVVAEPDATTVTVADTGNRTWSLASQAAGSAVFTATA